MRYEDEITFATDAICERYAGTKVADIAAQWLSAEIENAEDETTKNADFIEACYSRVCRELDNRIRLLCGTFVTKALGA